jgi:type VI secretion system protein ImpL
MLNSGLRFPLSDQMGGVNAQIKLKNAPGTQNCDWWLTNDAVLIDTAGRYAGTALNTDGAAEGSPEGVEERQALNTAEWRGFLGILRKHRARAPINGTLLAIDIGQLLQDDAQQIKAHAAHLRARLEELRTHLGIQFPIYVVLTKADVLRGFTAYFHSLTSEARAQVWGFTLPWKHEDAGLQKLRRKASEALRRGPAEDASPLFLDVQDQVANEYDALVDRIQKGLSGRLQEEFELDQRQAMYLLPYEMAALKQPLLTLLSDLFAPSRYDTTQTDAMLRGVYFTSAQQTGDEQITPKTSLYSRLFGHTYFKETSLVQERKAILTKRSFFVTDLLLKVIVPEAHLVKPNLKWEARMRLLRWMGHGLSILVFFWISAAISVSFHNNLDYLKGVGEKTEELTQSMKQWLNDKRMENTDKVLEQAQLLPVQSGLQIDAPPLSFTYGLYSAPPISSAAQENYAQLLERLVLPIVIERMEEVMRHATAQDDRHKAYETLRVYLMLHDPVKYMESLESTRDIRTWVTQDWQTAQTANPSKIGDRGAKNLAERLGNNAAMVEHLEWMFSGKRLIQSGRTRNENLVQQVRSLLDKQSSSERLYQRLKQTLKEQAPHDFTLVRALGPQAGTLFSRASGQTLEQGVPGLFTYDGYHNVFSKKMTQMLAWAEQDDRWVMTGNSSDVKTPGQEKTKSDVQRTRTLTEDIRSQYLTEYAQYWSQFLSDIRLIKTETGGTLGYDLSLLRQLAAVDSPLIRLSKMAARETTLSRPLQTDDANKSLFDKATDQINQQQNKAETGLGLRPEQRMERQWVDEKFAALREVVTGKSEGSPSAAAAKTGLDTVSNALNEFYTVLVVADTAISSGSLPPAGAEAATKLRIEASKLPSPLKEVLLDVSNSGTDKVSQGASGILRTQALVQLDRILGTLAFTVSDPCQRFIAGRYPFANSEQEVAIEDFNAFFSAGGASDDYFRKHLAPYVDTGVRPWRYKTLASLAVAGEGNAPAPAVQGNLSAPTLTGELLKLLQQSGPNPDHFAQIDTIRDMFFREAGGKRFSWRGEYRVTSLDASVNEWLIDLDGQVQRYAHGATQPIPISWPGPRGGTMVETYASPRIKSDTSGISLRGPWAWMRLIEKGKISPSASAGRHSVEFTFDNRRAGLEISSAGPSPFNNATLRNFTCPGRAR